MQINNIRTKDLRERRDKYLQYVSDLITKKEIKYSNVKANSNRIHEIMNLNDYVNI